jgi:hypothetical protein
MAFESVPTTRRITGHTCQVHRLVPGHFLTLQGVAHDERVPSALLQGGYVSVC